MQAERPCFQSKETGPFFVLKNGILSKELCADFQNYASLIHDQRR